MKIDYSIIQPKYPGAEDMPDRVLIPVALLCGCLLLQDRSCQEHFVSRTGFASTPVVQDSAQLLLKNIPANFYACCALIGNTHGIINSIMPGIHREITHKIGNCFFVPV